jgi:periplasmic copper chaperone A
MFFSRSGSAAFLLSAAALSFSFSAWAQAAPKVDAAWARPTVAGQSGGGGFLKITGGLTADRLVGATAPISKTVELHTMEMDGNVMRMREVPGIDIPAGKTVELKPGGLHVMFIGLTQTLKAGANFPLTLRFEKAGEVKVTVQVAQQAPGGAAAPGAKADPHAGHKH